MKENKLRNESGLDIRVMFKDERLSHEEIDERIKEKQSIEADMFRKMSEHMAACENSKQAE